MATLVDKYFSKADFDSIEEAVRKAELSTSGELAVELTSHSKHWLSERLVHAFSFSLLCMLVTLYFTREVNWGVFYNVTEAMLWGGIGFVVVYVLWGRFVLGRASRRRQVVWLRALRAFRQLTPTKGHTGVLIFLSLEEEQAAIVADTGIASKVPADYWHGPHAMIDKAIKEGRHAEGIVEAIETITIELARYFPRQGDDVNELPDRPRIVD